MRLFAEVQAFLGKYTGFRHRAVLVTNNEREFRRVPNLKIQNWSR
jgi:hypothetical protein